MCVLQPFPHPCATPCRVQGALGPPLSTAGMRTLSTSHPPWTPRRMPSRHPPTTLAREPLQRRHTNPSPSHQEHPSMTPLLWEVGDPAHGCSISRLSSLCGGRGRREPRLSPLRCHQKIPIASPRSPQECLLLHTVSYDRIVHGLC